MLFSEHTWRVAPVSTHHCLELLPTRFTLEMTAHKFIFKISPQSCSNSVILACAKLSLLVVALGYLRSATPTILGSMTRFVTHIAIFHKLLWIIPFRGLTAELPLLILILSLGHMLHHISPWLHLVANSPFWLTVVFFNPQSDNDVFKPHFLALVFEVVLEISLKRW